MSKSIPGSWIDASMRADDIRVLLFTETGTATESDGSSLLQMYARPPEIDGQACDRAAATRRNGGPAGTALREKIAERTISAFSRWPR
ncbi:hypothetical protein [Streptomyces sp. NPDC056549]|uniref:hypothetical protein n=1 Tax=Streptomyces sp. NPDC056549 TaxID=3345864 RepID=UPI0036840662